MKLVIHALPITPGGGLTALMGLLDGWRRGGRPLHVTVLNSHAATLDTLRASGLVDRLEGVLVGAGAARAFAWQNLSMPRFVRELRPDVVLATNHFVPRMPAPLVVHHQNLYRFVSRAETGRRFSATDLLRDRLARLALERAAGNVFISEYVLEAARRRYHHQLDEKRCRVIYNGVPGAWLQRAAVEPDRYAGEPRIVAVQSAAAHKDNPTLIATLAELARRAPHVDWRLRIAGGPGRGSWDDVRRLAKEQGVAERIEFLGHLGPGQLESEFRSALCLVFTSVLEAFGLPPIEAMTCRCPAVAARTTAMPEVIGSAGLLVEPRQPGEFAEAVLRLWNEPDLRRQLVESGLKQAARFSWDESALEFYRLFEAVAGTPAR